jgi:hypothetical protein
MADAAPAVSARGGRGQLLGLLAFVCFVTLFEGYEKP